mgnify:FL=1
MATDGMEMTLSAKERMLKNFKQERQELIKNRAKEPHLFKNRLRILDGKIDFLQKEVKRQKARVGPAPAKPAKIVAKPIKVRLKRSAPMEPRKRYFLAKKNNVVDLKPQARSEKRVGPKEAVMPARVEVKPLASAERRQEPQKEAVPPKKVEFLPIASVAGRTQAQEQPIPAETETLPRADEIVKMKNKGVKTGADWKNMPLPDKEIYILSVMGNLNKRDVYLMKSYGFYIRVIDKAINENPDLNEEYVHRILMMTAYESEPETRKDIEKVWK